MVVPPFESCGYGADASFGDQDDIMHARTTTFYGYPFATLIRALQ
jgi:hypothetical protein